MAISQRQSKVVGGRRRATDRNNPEHLCTRCGGARVESAEADRRRTPVRSATVHTVDGDRYEPPEVRQYSH